MSIQWNRSFFESGYGKFIRRAEKSQDVARQGLKADP
jgi:hypothetical protein